MYLLTVTYLDDTYHGQKRAGVLDWPPAPYRLFQALLSGVHKSEHELTSAYRALRWLERQAPPMIIAPDVCDNLAVRMPGINNQDQERRMVRSTSQANLAHHQVHYLWDVPEHEDAEILETVAAGLFKLGCSQDTAYATFTNVAKMPVIEASHKLWTVNNTVVGNQLRVPIAGTLDDLIRVHQLRTTQLTGALPNVNMNLARCFATHTYTTDKITNYAVFKLETVRGETLSFDSSEACHVSSWVRHAALQQTKRLGFPGNIEVYVAGHTQAVKGQPEGHQTVDRFAYVPLPTIGHQYADGRIRRVAVTEPFSGDGKKVGWAARALNGYNLVGPDGEYKATLTHLDYDPVLALYVRPTVEWSSVTPVVLPYKGRVSKRQAASIFYERVFPHAGLAGLVESFELDEWWFRRWERPFLRDYMVGQSLWKVWVRFKQPIAGPLALGAGRFCGLGVLAHAY